MLDLKMVLELVEPRLESMTRQNGVPVVVVEVKRVKNGWLVSYNTAKFIETGNLLDGLLQNYPLVVGDDGRLRGSIPGSAGYDPRIGE
jgi:hypothetical protein